jgi:hypothetical protein
MGSIIASVIYLFSIHLLISLVTHISIHLRLLEVLHLQVLRMCPCLSFLSSDLLNGSPIPHLVEVIPQFRATPRIHLTIQRSTLSLQHPPPHILRVC